MTSYIYTIDLTDYKNNYYTELVDISVSACNWEQAKEQLLTIWKQNYLDHNYKEFNCSKGPGVHMKVDEAVEMLKDMKEDDRRVKKQDTNGFYLESTYSEW